MKRLFFTLLFVTLCVSLSAQDVITTKSGEDIRVKVLEVGQDDVKYVKESSLDGPTYTLSKADIMMITYKDGSRDVFSDYKKGISRNTLDKAELADLRPGMKYKELKGIYSTADYNVFRGEEKYNPAVMGLCSFLIPGLGQMISGEGGRGVGHLLGTIALGGGGTALLAANAALAEQGARSIALGIGGLVCYAGVLALDIYSIVDAVKVAKVRNMYLEDMKQLAFNIKVVPYYDTLCMTNNYTPVAGIGLRVSF